MKYEIEMPAEASDTMPLALVAHAMALRDATANGSEFDKLKFTYRLAKYERILLKHAREGSLQVCDDVGEVGSPADLIAANAAGAGLVEVLREVSSGHELNHEQSWLINLLVKLKALNDWAVPRGDEFLIIFQSVKRDDRAELETDKAEIVVATSTNSGAKLEQPVARRARLLRLFLDERRLKPHGALARLARREGVKSSTMSVLIDKAKREASLAVDPLQSAFAKRLS